MTKNLRIGALISGGGTNLQAIIDGCEDGSIDGEMVFVGTDNPKAKGLERAGKHKIPTFVVDYKKEFSEVSMMPRTRLQATLMWDIVNDEFIDKAKGIVPPGVSDPKMFLVKRVAAEIVLYAKMGQWDFDLLVLAGFMRNLTPYFIDLVNIDPERPRIMNIHPALLPAFPGTDGYGDTFEYGCRVGGCTVHFIDYGEDTGPIIGQAAFPIYPSDLLSDIKDRGLELEWELYPKCIQMFAENRPIVFSNRKGRKMVLFGETHNSPVAVTSAIRGIHGKFEEIDVQNEE